MRILAIVPARGGSKGIKDKNIIRISGKPLISYTIDLSIVLIKRKLIAKAILSSDSEKIIQVAKKQGLEVPFRRPKKFASDRSKAIEYILHAIEYFENRGEKFDSVLILQPTSPLRNVRDVTAAINLFIRSRTNSLISVYKEEYINELVMYKMKNKGKVGVPLNKDHSKGVRRQEHGSTYVRNGCIYLTKVSYLKRFNQLISPNPVLYEMPKRR